MKAKTITKKDLVDRIAEQSGNKRVVVKTIIQQFLNEIIKELSAGNRLEFRDFGVFEVRPRAARMARNPKTNQKVQVPSKRTVKFKVGRLMKEQLSHSPDDAPATSPPAHATAQPQTLAPPGTPAVRDVIPFPGSNQ